MKLGVLSGKGGTGKTYLSTALARAWADASPGLVLVDADVEGPNADRFLPGLAWSRTRPVTVPVPELDEAACDLCGACESVCRYHALALIPGQRMMFIPSLCHSCGACRMICPRVAIREVPRSVGELREGVAMGVPFVQGIAAIGEERATPAIAAALERGVQLMGEHDAEDLLIDGPPGASCPCAEVVQAVDACLVVTEPTPFGLHDLRRVHGLIRARGKPMAVVINRARGGDGDQAVHRFCEEVGVSVVLEVPDRRDIAEAYAAGVGLVDAEPSVLPGLVALRQRLRERVAGARTWEAAG